MLTNLGLNNNLSPAQFFASSQVWTCYKASLYRLSAMGAGASGSAGSMGGEGWAFTGGGGGGFCEKEVYLPYGFQLTLTVGAGGEAIKKYRGQGGLSGNDGGTTSIIGAGIAMYAYGGIGGGPCTLTTRAGALGGSASGGDINFNGGASGSVVNSSASQISATGGGAPGSPYGNGGNGGNQSGTQDCSTGGGAIGGNNAESRTSGYGKGGGTGGGLLNALGLPINASSDGRARTLVYDMTAPYSLGPCVESLFDPLRCLTGGPGASVGASILWSNCPGLGAGGNGGTQSVSKYCATGAVFGGGGGEYSAGSYATNGGSSIFGGGGGGAINVTASSIYATSGTGGNGLIVIERIG